jgi:hypothetical protein
MELKAYIVKCFRLYTHNTVIKIYTRVMDTKFRIEVLFGEGKRELE